MAQERLWVVTQIGAVTRMRKGEKFEWTPEHEEAFNKLKACLVSAKVLAYPTEAGTFILDTDASNTGIGAVLHQKQGPTDEERVIAYASKSLDKSRQNYCTTKKELYAVVEFVKHFRHYLYGQKFIIRTDHASLIWLRNFANHHEVTSRWLSILETYDYEITHCKGSKHINADALSRLPTTHTCRRMDCPDCSAHQVNVVRASSSKAGSAEPQDSDNNCNTANAKVPEADNQWLLQWDTGQLREWQQADPCIRVILEWMVQSQGRPKWRGVAPYDAVTKSYCSQWNVLQEQDGLLYRQWYPPGSKNAVMQLVAPRELRDKVLHELHSSHTAGHLGIKRLTKSVRQRFYWPG